MPARAKVKMVRVNSKSITDREFVPKAKLYSFISRNRKCNNSLEKCANLRVLGLKKKIRCFVRVFDMAV